MKLKKRFEKFCKNSIRSSLKNFLKPVPVKLEDFTPESILRILVVRQDSRIGNLVLMTPLIRGLKETFSTAEIDVLISEGFEEILINNPYVDHILIFKKKIARLFPWWYLIFIHKLKKAGYDLAIDVSNGYHFSFNNVLLTALSGARYRMGYDRCDAGSFLNLLVPLPPENMHMSDSMLRLVKYISPDVEEYPLSYYVTDDNRSYAVDWLKKHSIMEFDSFFVVN